MTDTPPLAHGADSDYRHLCDVLLPGDFAA